MKRLARSLRSQKFALLALVVLAILAVAGFVASIVAPGGGKIDLASRLLPPSLENGHPLGTDQLGRDLLVRLLAGTWTEILIGLGALAIAFAIGVSLGLLAGYRGGRVESVIVFLADAQLSFPSLLIAIVFVFAFGHDVGPIIIVLGVTFWMIFARTARQATRAIKGQDYVQIARVMGEHPFRVVTRHVLRNSWPALIALGTIELPRIILGEVSLSFLGFGVSPPAVSLGLILGDGAEYLTQQWWVSTFAGLFITLLVLSLNLSGRWLQGAMDPLRAHLDLVDRPSR